MTGGLADRQGENTEPSTLHKTGASVKSARRGAKVNSARRRSQKHSLNRRLRPFGPRLKSQGGLNFFPLFE